MHNNTPTFYFLYQLRERKRSSTPTATSTPSAQLLVSNTILQQKEPGVLREMFDSGTRAGNIHDSKHLGVPEN